MAARIILGLSAALCCAATAQAGTASYSVIYAFGDSLSDAGNDYINSGHAQPVSPPYSKGRFTNGNVWVQDLAATLNLPAIVPSLNHGTDFAFGGAYTGSEPLHPLGAVDLPSQLAQFMALVPHPSATALYTVAIGSNDVRAAVPYFLTEPAIASADITDAVNNEVSFINNLASLGAKTVEVLNVTDLGVEPVGASAPAAYTAVCRQYNAQLGPALAALAAKDHISITVTDLFTLVDTVVANPAAYGFKNVTTPVWTGTFNSSTSGTLNAHGAAQNTYLFWDNVHPTAAGHSIISGVVAPLF